MPTPSPIRNPTAACLLLVWATAFAGAQSNSTAPIQIEAARLSVRLLLPDQMTASDREAAQQHQRAIATSAQFYGYAVDSSYTYRQIACPVALDNLLLAYETTSANGSVSRFTAVVRRGAAAETAGRHGIAQIVPILHFGVAPFVPAIASPHSINVFNAAISAAPNATQVLADTQAGNQPLLVRSLCYLAIVGAEPAAIASPLLDPATIHAPIPTLVFEDRAKIRQVISVRSSASSYEVWALTFQSGGSLLTATRQERPIDRTPLVLNATNSGSTTTQQASGMAVAAPMTPAESAAPAVEPSPVPSLAAGRAAAASMPSSEPAAAPVSAPTASQVEPLSSTPTVAVAPPPPSAPVPSATAPEAAAAILTPQPPEAHVSPEAAAPEPMPASTPSRPSAAFVAMSPVVDPAPPLPPGRFIANPPQPPSRFIPDSALKTPPHLPQ